MKKKLFTVEHHNAIYIGGGFMESQLLYILPFAAGYAKEKGISRLVIDRILPRSISNNACIKEIISEYHIVYLERQRKSRISTLKRFYNRFRAISLSNIIRGLKLQRKDLLSNSSWYECQIDHAIWDTAMHNSADGTTDINWFNRVLASNAVECNIRLARLLAFKYKVTDAILGHVVYSGRALAAEFAEQNVNVIAHASNVFYKMPSDGDLRWSFISPTLVNFATNYEQSLRESSIDYWKSRFLGISSYVDASKAYEGCRVTSHELPTNVLFLHVFRDSPFNCIDRSRLFADYIDWVGFTLSVIANSKETWLIRPHPSALSWGEDQYKWLARFSTDIFDDDWPAHIGVDNEYSNMAILSHAKRVVTHHGTVHLEAACRGIKPIVMSDVTLSNYNKTLVNKPQSMDEYSRLLLCSSELPVFKLNTSEVEESIMLLYIREELLQFNRDTGSYSVKRFDGESAFKNEFKSVENMQPYFTEKMCILGSAMTEDIDHSVSIRYLDDWVRYNKSILNTSGS